MRIVRTVFLLFLLCTGVVCAQKTGANLFVGTWIDGQTSLKVEFLGKDYACTFVDKKGNTLNSKNVAFDGNSMYVDFSEIKDSCYLVIGQRRSSKRVSMDTALLNHLDSTGLKYKIQFDTLRMHLIFSCTHTKGKIKITKHSIKEFPVFGKSEIGPKNYVGLYKRVGKIEKVPLKKIPVDSVKAIIARQLKSIDDLYKEYLLQETNYNYNYCLEMNTFDKYNTAIALMERMYPSLKSDSIMTRRYTECLFSRATIYKNYLSNPDKYIEDLRKIKKIIPYTEVIQAIAVSNAERELLLAKSLSDSVRVYEKAVEACQNLDEIHLDYSSIYNVMVEDDSLLTTEDYLTNSVLSPIIKYVIKRTATSGKTLDSVSSFFLKNPQVVYLGNVNCAIFTMLNCWDNEHFSDAIVFYENIKQNFPFNDSLNTLYVIGLINNGYWDIAIKELLRKSRATSPSDSLHKIVQFEMVEKSIINGKTWDNVKDIEDNVADFAKYLQVPEFALYDLLAFSYFYNNDYQKAYSNIQTAIELSQDSSFYTTIDFSNRMLLRANIISRLSEKESSAMQRDLQILEAEKSYQAVIDYEDSLDIIFNKPLAYIGLKNTDKAIESLQKMLEAGMDSLKYFFMVVQVYARLGDTARACSAIKEIDAIMTSYGLYTMETTYEFLERMRKDPYLESIRDTILKIYKKYEITTSNYYHQERFFDTLTTIVPFSSSRNGTIFLKECRIGNIELNGLIFDPGAEISQISRALVDKLLKQGTIRPEDCLGPLTTEVADGKKQVNGMVYRIPSFEIGTINLKNVHAFVPDNPPNVPLLLGENAFGDMIVTINPRKLTLSFTQIVERKKQ